MARHESAASQRIRRHAASEMVVSTARVQPRYVLHLVNQYRITVTKSFIES
jgi:hypothetical protein